MEANIQKIQMKAFYYNINIDWVSERNGILSNPELINKMEVSFPNKKTGIWTPEHLLIAAVNSCFMITFLSLAKKLGLEFLKYNCSAKGKIEKMGGKYLITEIELGPVVTIKKTADKKKSEEILQNSLAFCLISNSLKSKVSLVKTVNIFKNNSSDNKKENKVKWKQN